MCGAGIGFKEVEIRRIMWTGKSEKKAQKIFEKRKAKILKERPEFNNCREIDTSREEWIEKFFEGTAGIPVFAGYVEQDPFYSPEIAEEIKKRNAENVEVVKFERTDFTFRKCNVNKRIHELGYMVDDKKKIPPMNPEVAEKIIEWLEKIIEWLEKK